MNRVKDKGVLLGIALLLYTVASAAAEPPPAPDATTVAQLKEFSISLNAALKDVHGDDQVTIATAELNKLSKKISDEHLSSVEQFALSKDGESIRWLLAIFMVERGKFDSAANLFLFELAKKQQGDRRYAMWKSWEYYFGERKDYLELSRRIGISLVHQFEIGNADYRLVIAELFGKGAAEAKLSLDEFKKAIDFDKKTAKPEKTDR